jgi:hypothetical protein
MPCSIDGCSRDPYSKGLCASHYRRLVRYGDPLVKKQVLSSEYPKGKKWCPSCESFRDAKKHFSPTGTCCKKCNNARVTHLRKIRPERFMLIRSRARAKKLGLQFNLEECDIIIPDVCPVLGIPLYFSNTGKKGATNNTPTLDRADNSKGYLKGNVFVISSRANLLKRDAEEWELRAIADYMKSVLRLDG